MDNLLSVQEVADMLHCHPQTLYRNKTIPRTYIPGIGIRFKESSLVAFINANSIRLPQNQNEIFPVDLPKAHLGPILRAGGGSEMAKAKSKSRYNLGYGAVYERKTKKGIIRWYLDYRDASGKRIQKVASHAGTRDEALTALQDSVHREQLRLSPFGTSGGEILFEDFALTYLTDYIQVTRRNWNSDKCRLERMAEFFKGIKLIEITPLAVERLKASRLKLGNSKATINRYLALLKRMFTLAIQEGHIAENPAKKVRLFSESDSLKERVLTVDEEKRLFQNCSPHLKPTLILALNTGMRPGEYLKLKWTQIDFGTRKIRVEKTKSGKVRFININTPLFQELQRLKSQNGNNPYVLTDPRTEKPMLRVTRSFKTACKRAEIQGLRLYDLRHTFASRLIQRGADIETARELLGHSSVRLTQRYTHSNDEMKQRAVELLGQVKSPNSPQNEENLLHGCDTDNEDRLKKNSGNSEKCLMTVN
jgi:integrase